jgi:Ca-activated chloride channel family protein
MERSVQGIDIMLVLDVSASMNIEDLAEESRFDIAKRTIRSFVQGRSNDRIGFSVFSGEGVTLAPPTLDYGIVLQAISDAKIGELKDGTAIGDGLAVAVARLRNSDAKSKIIILLTDGDSNIGQVDPLTAGELAAGFGLKVYTIAIGKEGRVRMPIRAQNIFGKTVTTYQWFDNALNTELLQKIAESTQGKFYRVSDSSTLDAVYKEIDRLERTEVKANEKVRTEENFEKPLLWALVLLLLERILALWVWRVIP